METNFITRALRERSSKLTERIECSDGPVSTMPGTRWSIDPHAGIMCDEHPDTVAAFRVQGETDSMGCEYAHLCVACDEAFRLAGAVQRDGQCEWHKGWGLDLKPFRDMDEGMGGPVYMTCADCRRRVNDQAAAELAEMERSGSFIADDYWDDPENEAGDLEHEAMIDSMEEDREPILSGPDPEEVAASIFADEFGPAVTPATRMALQKERS